MTHTELEEAKVRKLGLDPRVIVEHQSKIRKQLETGEGIVFPVQESGTPENGVVLKLDGLDAEQLRRGAREGLAAGELCSFVPAAGAASRFLKVFDTLRAARESGAEDRIRSALEELRALGELADLPFDVPLPRDLGDAELLRYGLQVAERYRAWPKGLMPATLDGLSFLELKLLEHEKLNPAGGLALVVADGLTERFAEHLAGGRIGEPVRRRVSILVQGKPLSTLRFEADCSPVLDVSGDYVPVVAGHGELLRLFPEVSALGPHKSVFIVNVDNIIGTTEPVVEAFQRLFGFHREFLGLMEELRECCLRHTVPEPVAQRARALCSALGRRCQARGGAALLLELQAELFHSGAELRGAELREEALWVRLEQLYRRPLTVHGLVQNTGKDVGAIPVFIELDGRRVKICLEMPHATAEDQTTYFRNPKKATHFNPVFVMHELCPHIPAEERTDRRFWMLTKKPYGGREVYYHETVLYEAVGNSLTNNVVFVEIPRFLFHPHKEFSDCRGRTAESYGFEKT